MPNNDTDSWILKFNYEVLTIVKKDYMDRLADTQRMNLNWVYPIQFMAGLEQNKMHELS